MRTLYIPTAPRPDAYPTRPAPTQGWVWLLAGIGLAAAVEWGWRAAVSMIYVWWH